MAPVQAKDEQALEKERALEQAALKEQVTKRRSEKLLTKLKKGKILTQEELAAKVEAAEKAFGEKVLASLIEEEKALDGKVLAQKKKALEFAEVLQESRAKAKHPLSAAEKKQIEEQIEKNALEHAHQMREDIAEATAMQKKKLGHALSGAEVKIMEHLEIKVEKEIEETRVAMEEHILAKK